MPTFEPSTIATLADYREHRDEIAKLDSPLRDEIRGRLVKQLSRVDGMTINQIVVAMGLGEYEVKAIFNPESATLWRDSG
jgi:hypothetical protein